VVTGFASLDGFLQKEIHSLVHDRKIRHRIANGKFTLDGKPYTLAAMITEQFARGNKGYDKVYWNIENKVTAVYNYLPE